MKNAIPDRANAASAAWPADSVERWQIERLTPYARNARTHSDEQVAQIAASIQEFGFTNPVLADETGTIIAGHGRVRAMELAPAYVDLTIARWQMLYPDMPVRLANDGRDYDAVAADRAGDEVADAA